MPQSPDGELAWRSTVAVLGTAEWDVTQLDPPTLLIGPWGNETVPPLRWSFEDVATPYEPFVGKNSCDQCTAEGPDGFLGLTFKYSKQEVVQALGLVSDGDCIAFHLYGQFNDERYFDGEDVVVIVGNTN